MNALRAAGEQIINGERRRRNYLGHGLERTIKCGHEDTLPGTTSGGTMKEIQDTVEPPREGVTMEVKSKTRRTEIVKSI